MLGVEKEMLGVMSLMQALDLAEEADTDVVLINPNGVPPVARLVQVSKYKFELAKAAKEASKKQREARYAGPGQCCLCQCVCLSWCVLLVGSSC